MLHKKKLILTFLLLTCIGVSFALPGTLAYMTAHTPPLVNTFATGLLPEGEVSTDIQIQKTITSVRKETIGPGGFLFELKREDNESVMQCTSDELGSASLSLAFDWDDAGKTYRYMLYEVNNGIPHVAYSPLVYEIEIDVIETAEHTLALKIRLNGSQVNELVVHFENIYGQDLPPDTGDHAHPLLYGVLVMMCGMSLMLLLRSRKQEN